MPPSFSVYFRVVADEDGNVGRNRYCLLDEVPEGCPAARLENLIASAPRGVVMLGSTTRPFSLWLDEAAATSPLSELTAVPTPGGAANMTNVFVKLLGVPAAAGGGGGGGGGTPPAWPSLAELMAKQARQDAKLAKLEAQQEAVDAELLPVLQKGLFAVLDLEDQPICCGFFVRESGVAITVNHDNKKFIRPGDIVHAVMLRHAAMPPQPGGGAAAGGGGAAAAAAALPDEVLLEFKVHSFSPEEELDYTCLVLTSPVPAGTFQPLPLPPPGLSESRLTGAHATLLLGSIALNRFFSYNPSASLVPCTIFTTHPDRVLYTAATAGGDSGGALVLHGKVLVAMHTEGLNDVPDNLHITSPREGKRPAKKLKLSEASPTTTGAALRLDLPHVQAAIAAAHAAVQPAAAAGGAGAAAAGGAGGGQ